MSILKNGCVALSIIRVKGPQQQTNMGRKEGGGGGVHSATSTSSMHDRSLCCSYNMLSAGELRVAEGSKVQSENLEEGGGACLNVGAGSWSLFTPVV